MITPRTKRRSGAAHMADQPGAEFLAVEEAVAGSGT